MAKIKIDGKEFEISPDKNLLEVCLSKGFDLPYFCWHPAMGSVGACRQCAVKKYRDEDDETGQLVMSCMEPASDGTRISVEDEEAKQFRASVIEWLMTNHPHDCPTCDEGGECHLQDMTVMSGHNYRRHRFNKRTFQNQYLGNFINHEMNRCITCYRCVRFYRDYAGGIDLEAMASGTRVYFGRAEEGTLESEFSGNLVEVCPTGVFTDKTLKKHYTRKWDFTHSPSVCHGCSLGCNIITGERYGELRRITSRYNDEVNGYFICDRGRFGYEYVNGEDRYRYPMKKVNDSFESLDVGRYAAEMKEILPGKRMLGIGSARASLESNYTLRKLVGEEHFSSGWNEQEQHLVNTARSLLEESRSSTPSMKEIEQADAVLILGEDLINTAPMMGLAVRQAAQQRKKDIAESRRIPRWHTDAVQKTAPVEQYPVMIATVQPTKLDELDEQADRLAPEDIAALGHCIAHRIDGEAPALDLDEKTERIQSIADALLAADHPVVISGTSLGNPQIMQAAANIVNALQKKEEKGRLSLAVQEVNDIGLTYFNGFSLEEAVQKIEDGEYDHLFVLENDLSRHMNPEQMKRLMDVPGRVIALDHLENQTTRWADYVMPAAPFAETDGTVVNNEGRAQRFFQGYVPEGEIKESWRWLAGCMHLSDRSPENPLENLDDVIEQMCMEIPGLKGVEQAAPFSDYRKNGQKIARETHRYSGRTSMHAHEHVSEGKPPLDPDTPLSFTMEGYSGKGASGSTPFFWSPGWNSDQAINKFQIEVGGPLHDGEPGVRLIEPDEGRTSSEYYSPEASVEGSGETLTAFPWHHIYGSEELSARSPAVAERSPKARCYLASGTAKKYGLKSDEHCLLRLGDSSIELPVEIVDEMAEACVGIPRGYALIPGVELPTSVELKKNAE